jgi:hypothetical protein
VRISNRAQGRGELLEDLLKYKKSTKLFRIIRIIMTTAFSSQSKPAVKPPASPIDALGGIALIVIPF